MCEEAAIQISENARFMVGCNALLYILLTGFYSHPMLRCEVDNGTSDRHTSLVARCCTKSYAKAVEGRAPFNLLKPLTAALRR